MCIFVVLWTFSAFKTFATFTVKIIIFFFSTAKVAKVNWKANSKRDQKLYMIRFWTSRRENRRKAFVSFAVKNICNLLFNRKSGKSKLKSKFQKRSKALCYFLLSYQKKHTALLFLLRWKKVIFPLDLYFENKRSGIVYLKTIYIIKT